MGLKPALRRGHSRAQPRWGCFRSARFPTQGCAGARNPGLWGAIPLGLAVLESYGPTGNRIGRFMPRTQGCALVRHPTGIGRWGTGIADADFDGPTGTWMGRPETAPSWETPTAFRPKAQGWREARAPTLGHRHPMARNPNGVVPARRPDGPCPLPCVPEFAWARWHGRNPVGVVSVRPGFPGLARGTSAYPGSPSPNLKEPQRGSDPAPLISH
jgi:hypothetical protein